MKLRALSPHAANGDIHRYLGCVASTQHPSFAYRSRIGSFTTQRSRTKPTTVLDKRWRNELIERTPFQLFSSVPEHSPGGVVAKDDMPTWIQQQRRHRQLAQQISGGLIEATPDLRRLTRTDS